MPALAITDHGTLAGALYHIQSCERHDIKPIVGCEFYFRTNIEDDRKARQNMAYYHLLLLAKTKEGFDNLLRLSSASYTEDFFYQKPCIDWKLLRKYSEGVILLSGCLSSLLPSDALRSDPDAIMRHLRVFQDIFKEDFYLEIQPHNIDEQRIVNLELCNLALREGVQLVATGDVHYPHKDWADTQDVLVMIATGQSKTKRERDELEGKGYMKFSSDSFYLRSEDEILKDFREHHSGLPDDIILQAIRTTLAVSNTCDHIQVSKRPKIPTVSRSVLESERIIRAWIKEGLKRIGKQRSNIYEERIEQEMAVIKKLHVLDYFLIVGDACRWAKGKDIRVGPGRGSACGSLVNYLIGITAVDPIEHGLLFERFLNEYRTELPDIDIDFQDNRRDEVRKYLADKYGDSFVVDVASFQSFGLKATIQDISRVLGIPYERARKATNALPEKTWGETYDSLERTVPQLKEFFEEYPEVRTHAIRLQGQAKNQSKHAAAVIVTDQPAENLIPMMRAKDGSRVTQWTERANAQLISPYGFLKIDLLSTDALTIQQHCIDLVRERTGKTIDLDTLLHLSDIDEQLEFKRVMDSFSHNRNLGIFQCSSPIMGALLRDIRPRLFKHLVAANALIRPGTERREYAARVNGKRYSIPMGLQHILHDTYGIMTYQEQFYQIVHELGKDITTEDAAVLLKIASKGVARDREVKKKLKNYEQRFLDGCEEKGIDGKPIWKELTAGSAEYLFNKSHATGYAIQAYQDMWLKVNYPLEFYTALLTVETSKVPQIIREAGLWGINVLPPDINISDRGFTIDGNNIRFGLQAIKGLGDAAIRNVLVARPLDSVESLWTEFAPSELNKSRKTALLKAGALDCWGGRNQWVFNDDCSARIPGAWSEDTQAEYELETLGIALSRVSDLEKYRDLIENKTVDREMLDSMEDQAVVLGGEIVNIKEHKTRNGGVMAFVDLAFDSSEYSLTLWPEKYDAYYPLMRQGNVVLVYGDWDSQRQATVVREMVTAAELANAC